MKKLIIILLFLLPVVSLASLEDKTCDGIIASETDIAEYTRFITMPHHGWNWDGANDHLRRIENHLKPEYRPDWSLLNDQERLAVNLYTQGTFGDINRMLRGLQVWDAEMENTFVLMCSGLNKLPEYQGQVVRILDINPEQFEKIKTNQIYFDPAFMSTSTDLVLIWQKNAELIIHSLHGRSVIPFSSHREEKEILLLPSAKFTVMKTEEFPDGELHMGRFKYVIELQEI